MLIPVIKDKKINFKFFKETEPGFKSVFAYRDYYAWKLFGNKPGLIAGSFRRFQNPLTVRYELEAFGVPLPPISPAEDRNLISPLLEMGCQFQYHWCFSCSANRNVPDADHPPREPFCSKNAKTVEKRPYPDKESIGKRKHS